MAAQTLAQVLEILRAKQNDANAVGIELVGVVGSMSRGEARQDSDVDIIVRLVGKCSFFRLFDFEQSLQTTLGRPVDLVFSEGMKADRRAYIERDLARL